jgi:hypothetical protein
MTVRTRLLLPMTALLVVACGVEASLTSETPTTTAPAPAQSSPDTTSPDVTVPDVDRVPDSTIPPMTGEVPEEIMDEILADAGDRAEVDPAQFEVVRSQSIEWPDGSLGCPEPGQFYTQAIVPGYWVVLQMGEETYDYRVTDNGGFSLCEQERALGGGAFPTPPTTTGGDS